MTWKWFSHLLFHKQIWGIVNLIPLSGIVLIKRDQDPFYIIFNRVVGFMRAIQYVAYYRLKQRHPFSGVMVLMKNPERWISSPQNNTNYTHNSDVSKHSIANQCRKKSLRFVSWAPLYITSHTWVLIFRNRVSSEHTFISGTYITSGDRSFICRTRSIKSISVI